MQDLSIQPETPFVYPDYWAIFNEQMKCIDSTEQHNVKNKYNLSGREFIREYRTIGFRGIRQSGKTRWVIQALNRFPDAIAIVSTVERRNDMFRTHDARGKELDHLTEGDNRVFTPKDIHNRYCDKGITLATFPDTITKAKYVIIDEADFVYGRVAGFTLRELALIYAMHAEGPAPVIVEVN